MIKISKKNKIIAISIIAVLLAGFIFAVGFVLIPRVGSAQKDYSWNGASSFDIANIETVKKTPGKEFKILQLTDTQLDMPFQSRKTLKAMIDKLITDNQPDLIAITGDLVAGVFTHFYVDDIIKIFDSYKIPWAPVFGNHDRELNANLYYQAKRYTDKSDYCLFKEGPNNIQGVGNYVVNVEENGKIVQSLYFMDSNGDRKYTIDNKEVKGYDYIYPNQIEWYTDNVKAINYLAGYNVPSMAFFHIPLPEYLTAYELAKKGSSTDAVLVGGEMREGSGAPPENTGFFDRMLLLGSTTHVFVGHDHINDSTVLYKGIYLTYGVKTGDFSSHHDDKMGGTLVTISDKVEVKRIYLSK